MEENKITYGREFYDEMIGSTDFVRPKEIKKPIVKDALLDKMNQGFLARYFHYKDEDILSLVKEAYNLTNNRDSENSRINFMIGYVDMHIKRFNAF